MGRFTCDPVIEREWARLRRLARSRPGVVCLGYERGQLALYFDPPREGISRVTLTATEANGTSSRDLAGHLYHAVVHRIGRRAPDGRRREVFEHPFPAIEWVHETVPDFDLLETRLVGAPNEENGSS